MKYAFLIKIRKYIKKSQKNIVQQVSLLDCYMITSVKKIECMVSQ